MKPDLAVAIEKVIGLREEAARGVPCDALLAQIEDGLSEGYAEALAADAWSLRVEEQLHGLIGDTVAPGRFRLRALALEHVRFQRELISLRSELAGLRRDRDRLSVRSSG